MSAEEEQKNIDIEIPLISNPVQPELKSNVSEGQNDKEKPADKKAKNMLDFFRLPGKNNLKDYQPTIELDSYILSSLLSGLFIPMLITYAIFECLWMIFVAIFLAGCCICLPFLLFCCFKSAFKSILFVIMVFISLALIMVFMVILLLPGIFVIFMQIIALNFIGEQVATQDLESLTADRFMFMKVGVIFIYIAMVNTELSQGLNSFFYILSLCKKLWSEGMKVPMVFGVLSLVLPAIQIATVFMLCNVSLMSILFAGDVMELIANFAGLYVILEFDNIMFNFVNLFPWRTFLQIIINLKIIEVSIYQLFKEFLHVFLKDLLNLEDGNKEGDKKEDDNEGKIAANEDKQIDNEKNDEKKNVNNEGKEAGNENKEICEKKENEEKKEVDNKEKEDNEGIKLGEDTDEITLNYSEAFGKYGSLFVLLKIGIMLGMTIYFLTKVINGVLIVQDE